MKLERLKKLEEICQQCKNCSLFKLRTNLVFGDGSPEAKIMFVGEAPGEDEDLKGIPFIGRSGALLRQLMASIGIGKDHYYIANIIKCRPPKNRPPSLDEINSCISYLKKQIEIISPKRIVLLGKTAVSGIFPALKEHPMGVIRQSKLLNFNNIPVFITYHPSAILRKSTLKNEYKKDFLDLQKIFNKLLIL